MPHKFTNRILVLSACGTIVLSGCTSFKPDGRAGPAAPATRSSPEAPRSELAAVLRYLAEKHPGETWKSGPEQLDSSALRFAYPKHRFYVIASPMPLPGGAKPATGGPRNNTAGPKPRRILSLCIRLGPKNQIEEFRNPADYNRGLVAIRADEDARKAAAAILSTLDGLYFGPAAVDPALVLVQKISSGWVCRMQTKNKAGRVVFDTEGRCISATMRYAGPFPG